MASLVSSGCPAAAQSAASSATLWPRRWRSSRTRSPTTSLGVGSVTLGSFVILTILPHPCESRPCASTLVEPARNRRIGETEESMPGEHLSPAELAAREGVSLAAVYNWNYTGTGPPYFRTGGTQTGPVRYRVADVERWELERMVEREP